MYPYNINNLKQRNNNNNNKTKVNPNNQTPINTPSPVVTSTSENINLTQSNKEILSMIEESLSGELHDHEYYRQLHALFDDANDKEIIRRLSLDELKHKKLLEELYKKISGKEPAIPKIEEIKISRNLLAELSKSINNEYMVSDFYKKLYLMLKEPQYRDIIFEIMMDENNHAGKLTYLYAKNKI